MRSLTIGTVLFSTQTILPIFSLQSSTPSPVNALTYISFSFGSGTCSKRSDLFFTIKYGISFSRKNEISFLSVSCSPLLASTTRRAISVRFKMRFVFCMRSPPSSPSSSNPGVSIIITGPRGRSSIAFLTGSVVVPGVSETTARSWPVIALTTLDFPALRHPKKPI